MRSATGSPGTSGTARSCPSRCVRLSWARVTSSDAPPGSTSHRRTLTSASGRSLTSVRSATGVAEDLERRIERLRVEAERAAVVRALVERQVVGVAVRAPRAAVEAAGLRAEHLEHRALAGHPRELAVRA